MREALKNLPCLLALAIVPHARPEATHEGPILVEVGLSAPVERAASFEDLLSLLGDRLVWRADGLDERAAGVRLAAIRIERGRVTGSRQSKPAAIAAGAESVARAIGQESLVRLLTDCCLSDGDPPVLVRGVSGTAFLDSQALERAVAALAGTGVIDGIFEVEPELPIDWGRQFVLVLAAESEADLSVRPLILVFDRL